MKTSSQELQLIWQPLQDIFLNFKGVDNNVIKALNKLGINVYGNKHPKIKIKDQVITLSSSPSDKYAGRQILRVIRRYYENN